MTATTALDDNTLIAMIVAGETGCFAILIDRHLGALKKCIGAMIRNGTDRDDLIQDVLLRIWSRLSTFRSESSFRTWMTRVAVNEVLQRHRREKRNPLAQVGAELHRIASGDESPHRSFMRLEATAAVHNAIARIPRKYREVLILRDLEQLTTEEAAHRLREPIPTVKTRLFRARLMLSASLRAGSVRGMPGAQRRDSLRRAA